jgi:hypothetical protein
VRFSEGHFLLLPGQLDAQTRAASLPALELVNARPADQCLGFRQLRAVELFTNGVSLGRQALNVLGHVEWDNVPYAAGTLQAIGYNNGVAVITNTVVTTGAPAQIALWPDRSTILADGRDVSVVTVAVLDALGRVVPTASNTVAFAVSGGAIIGVGNGDPSSHEADKASQRSVFNGLAQVIVQSTSQPGSITLTATATGLTSTNITITEAATIAAASRSRGSGRRRRERAGDGQLGHRSGRDDLQPVAGHDQRRSLHAHCREHRGREFGLHRQQRHQPDNVLLCGHGQWKRHQRQFGGSQRHAGSHCHRPDGDRHQRPDCVELERLARRQLQREAFPL